MPWRSCRAAPPSAPKATRSFNVLWHGRALLALLLTAWAVSSLLAHVHGPWKLDGCCNPPATAIRPAAFLSPPAFLPPFCPQLSPLLRVSRLWGANSLVFSEGVTSWTGSGWMCRCTSLARRCQRLPALRCRGAAPDPWGPPPSRRLLSHRASAMQCQFTSLLPPLSATAESTSQQRWGCCSRSAPSWRC